MKKRFGITGKITILSLVLVLISVLSILVVGYGVNYQQLDKAAGEELIGCANITTGLVDTDELTRLMNGDTSNFNEIQSGVNWVVDHKPIFKNAAIMSLDGKLLVPDKRLIEEGFKAGDQFYIDQEAVEMLLNMRMPAYSEIYEYGGVERKTGYAPIFKDHDPNNEIIALMTVDFDEDIIQDRTIAMLGSTVQTGSVFLIITGIIAYFVVRRMIRPIITIEKQVDRVAAGDLTVQPLQIKSRDEMGQLAAGVNKMVDNIRGIIQGVYLTTDKVAESSADMAATTEQVTMAATEVAENTTKVASDAEAGNEAIVEASQSLLQLSSLIQMAKNKATSAEENSKITQQSAEHGRDTVENVVQRMENIKNQTVETEQFISRLDHYSKEIVSITETITKIAEQTNLLALNAEIEAARAGEAGRGFAVVADEVRNLAEQSNREAGQVAQIVDKITGTTQDAVSATHQSRLEVEEGVEAVKEAGQALEKILEAVKSTVKDVQAISEVTDDEVATSDKIVDLINSLASFIENTAANAQQVSASTEQTSSSMQTIADSTRRLNEMASELKVSVSSFKI